MKGRLKGKAAASDMTLVQVLPAKFHKRSSDGSWHITLTVTIVMSTIMVALQQQQNFDITLITSALAAGVAVLWVNEDASERVKSTREE